MESINKELAQFTLKNIQLIEQSYDVLAKLDEHFVEKLNAVFDEWYKKIQNETPEWYRTIKNKSETQESIFFDWNSKYPNKNASLINGHYWLSTVGGLGKYDDDEKLTMGIHFGFNISYFNLKSSSAKEFLKQQFEKYPSLKKQGFEFVIDSYYGRTIFLPFKLDLDTLIQEYPDYDDTALEPFTNALDTVRDNLPVFKEIAAELQQYFKADKYDQE